MAAASTYAALRRRMQRILPILPPLVLATAFTSLTYNYSVQRRLRTEDQRLHSLRLHALHELRTLLLAQQQHVIDGGVGPSSSRRSGLTSSLSVEEEEEARELVRQISRLGLDPADVGFGYLLPSSAPASDPDQGSPRAPSALTKTGWYDVFFGGPNSHRARAVSTSTTAGGQDLGGSSSLSESTTDTMRRAIASAFKDFQVLGNGSSQASAKLSKEDEEVERWLSQALQDDPLQQSPAANDTSVSQPSLSSDPSPQPQPAIFAAAQVPAGTPQRPATSAVPLPTAEGLPSSTAAPSEPQTLAQAQQRSTAAAEQSTRPSPPPLSSSSSAGGQRRPMLI
ncbi:hypothetical protein V8E36_004841 [Tilletia maclaganii]